MFSPTFARKALAGLIFATLSLLAAAPSGAACYPQDLECGGTSADLTGMTPLNGVRMNAGGTELEDAGLQLGVLSANGTNCSSGEYARGVDASGNAEGCAADQDTDTTCNDAGVSCLFAGSASEGGAATTALALSSDGSNCSVGQYARGVDAAGNAQSCTADADTTCNDAGVSCLFAGSASEGGAATTALALNANGANCSVGEYARGVDAAGAAEGCTAIGSGDTTCLDAGVVCSFAGSATEGGPATTALALNANGANCSAGQYPLGVDAAGAVESCTADDDTPESGDFGNLTGGAGITVSSGTVATASGETDFLTTGALTCGAGTKGRASVGTSSTVLQYCDNAATPTLRYAALASSAGVATSATALAANGSNCTSVGGIDYVSNGVDASGNAEGCTAIPLIPYISVMSADDAFASTTVLRNGPQLALTDEKSYTIHGVLHVTQTSATPNLKVAMVTPGTPSFGQRWSFTSSCDGGNTDSGQTTSSGGTLTLGQTAQDCTVTVDGYFRVDAGESGTIILQYAQSTSNLNTTTVRKGSFLTFAEAAVY